MAVDPETLDKEQLLEIIKQQNMLIQNLKVSRDTFHTGCFIDYVV